MQDISYTSKLTQAEDGRPLALEYYIMPHPPRMPPCRTLWQRVRRWRWMPSR